MATDKTAEKGSPKRGVRAGWFGVGHTFRMCSGSTLCHGKMSQLRSSSKKKKKKATPKTKQQNILDFKHAVKGEV